MYFKRYILNLYHILYKYSEFQQFILIISETIANCNRVCHSGFKVSRKNPSNQAKIQRALKSKIM